MQKVLTVKARFHIIYQLYIKLVCFSHATNVPATLLLAMPSILL